MSNRLLERAENLDETIEFLLGGWSLLLNVGLFIWAVICIFYPSNWVVFFHWKLSSAFFAVILLVGMLRHLSWSPFFVGATITMTSSSISGIGGWGHERWSITWDELDRVEWGRFGVVIFKKGLKNWESPILQLGFYNVSLWVVVRCIRERLSAYQARKMERLVP